MKMKKCNTAKYRRRRARELANARPGREHARLYRAQQSAEAAEGRPSVFAVAGPTCPLCQLAITMDDLGGNIVDIKLNKKWIVAHRTCPTEVQILASRIVARYYREKNNGK